MEIDEETRRKFKEMDKCPWVQKLVIGSDIADIVNLLHIIGEAGKIRVIRNMLEDIAKDICPDLIGICRCNFCKKDFEGMYEKIPGKLGFHADFVCPSCRKYQNYLKMFSADRRHNILLNRRCAKCRVNKVQRKSMARRVCPSCFEYGKKKGKGKSRAFFQAMAMQEAVSNNS